MAKKDILIIVATIFAFAILIWIGLIYLPKRGFNSKPNPGAYQIDQQLFNKMQSGSR
jgi:hypothetical protein